MPCGCAVLKTRLVLPIWTLQHLPSPSILLIQQSPVQSSPTRNAAPFTPIRNETQAGSSRAGVPAAVRVLAWDKGPHWANWHRTGHPREALEEAWAPPGGSCRGSGWGSWRAAGEPGCAPMPPRDPASALPANAVANSPLLSSSHRKKYFSP